MGKIFINPKLLGNQNLAKMIADFEKSLTENTPLILAIENGTEKLITV